MPAHSWLGPVDLPVEAVVPDVLDALDRRGAAVLVAPPGAGKTTVVPLRALDAPWLGAQRIVVLEPRRLAARASAQRMASLIGEQAGATVGYRTRDEKVVGRGTRIEVITEGILVRRLQDDPGLEGIGLVILDEVHERNLASDLSLALIADVRTSLRPDLRVLAMSATVDADPFARVLGSATDPAPIVRSDGRQHPVAISYQPPAARDRLDAHVVRIVARTLAEVPTGDALVFLPGAADIRRVGDRLSAKGALPPSVAVHRLFGALSQSDQDLALAPSQPGRRRVVLSTDIAESSLTVAGVQIVVDAGLVRVPRFDPGTAMTTLQTEPASIASADQRAGRAGRLGPGVAVRLWDPSDRNRRSAFAVAEIEVADAAGLVLEAAAWGVAVGELALLDQPPASSLAGAEALLRDLGAIDDGGRLTRRGRAMVELPLHPRLAAMVLAGRDRGAGWTAAVVASVLEERDVLRGRPEELPVDLTVRAELVAASDGHHPQADRQAVRTARRRSRQLAQRAKVGRDAFQPDEVGPLVAIAYPDRIAQSRGRAAVRLRAGGGGSLPAADPLAREAFLAVARIDPSPDGPRVSLAAPLSAAEVDVLVGDDVEETVELRWDEERDDVRETRRRTAGALVLEQVESKPRPGPAVAEALVQRVRDTNGALLRWTPAATALRDRVAFMHEVVPDEWPDLSDAALVASLDEWLAPYLPNPKGRASLDRVDLLALLKAKVGHHRVADLERLTPKSFEGPDGSAIKISYGPDGPRASVKPQRLYGLDRHPTVAGGRVPVVLELLSPAGRPIQVTADLPGFWRGSWSEVRKDMAGRYPKHDWPIDPAG